MLTRKSKSFIALLAILVALSLGIFAAVKINKIEKTKDLGLKSVTAWIWKRNVRIYNKYGYSIVKVEKERGTMDCKAENKRYFLMNYKIYRNRFTTDCFSDYDVLKIDIQNGQLDGGEDLHDYYVMYKKAHSDRYATDCYGWFFRDEALKKKKSIVDYPAFGCSKATRAELHAENSYFIRALERVTEDKVD